MQKERDQLKLKIDNLIDSDLKTGLMSHLALLAKEDEIIDRARKVRSYPLYALVDIDLFKKYNTHLGMDEADKKLRALAD